MIGGKNTIPVICFVLDSRTILVLGMRADQAKEGRDFCGKMRKYSA